MSAYYGKGIQVKQHIIGESGLVGKGITLRIRGISFQTSLAAWLEFGTQPHYKAPSSQVPVMRAR